MPESKLQPLGLHGRSTEGRSLCCTRNALGEIVGQGSGTLVRTASGPAAILTAAHVFDGAKKTDALSESGAHSDIVLEVRRAPRIDVALAVCKETGSALDQFALDPALLADDHSHLKKGETVDVIGFPAHVKTEARDPNTGVLLRSSRIVIAETAAS